LLVGSHCPGVRSLGEINKVTVGSGQVFDVCDFGGVEGHGILGFADGLLDELGNDLAIGIGDIFFGREDTG